MKKFYYFVGSDEGRTFFDSAEEFLEHLRENDPIEAGAEELTEAHVASHAKID